MRLATAIVLLMTAPATAQVFDLPGFLSGTWESDPVNCTSAEPAAGFGLVIEADSSVIEIIDHSTEGRACEVVAIEGEVPRFLVSANCGYEESEGEAERLAIETNASGLALTMLTEGDKAAGLEPVTYLRCD